MPDTADKPAKAKGDTDTTSVSKGRFTVALSAELAEGIDNVGARLAKAVQDATGVSVELSRAQVVQSLVKTALAAQSNNGETAPS